MDDKMDDNKGKPAAILIAADFPFKIQLF